MRKRALADPFSRERSQDEWRDWPNLPSVLIDDIAGRLLGYDVAEYLRLRSACREWRACTVDPREGGSDLDSRFRPRNWIMLSSSQGVRRQFINTSTGACAQIDLPELSGHHLETYTEGLLLLRDEASDAVRLLNPLTRALTDLPPITVDLGSTYVAWKANDESLARFIYAGISDETSPATVVLFMCGTVCSIAYAKPGDERWALMDKECWKSLPTQRSRSHGQLLNIIRYVSVLTMEGCIYLSTLDGNILKVSIHPKPRLVPVVVNQPFDLLPSDVISYLLPANNNNSTMLMVRYYQTLQHLSLAEQRNMKRRKDVIKVQINDTIRRYSWHLIQVFQVNLANKTLVPVVDIGHRALFIGDVACLSISTKRFPSVAGNAVYLGVNSSCSTSFGVRYLLDKRIDPPFQFVLGDEKEPFHFRRCGLKQDKKIVPLARPFTLQEYLVCYTGIKGGIRDLS
uniref:Uncharacterized protein n=1 Tax=Avena sativa TaxID=4498 RepID=A0ACD5YJE0_AVESA